MRHKALRILYRWLEEEDEIDQNPMAKVKPPMARAQRFASIRGRFQVVDALQ